MNKQDIIKAVRRKHGMSLRKSVDAVNDALTGDEAARAFVGGICIAELGITFDEFEAALAAGNGDQQHPEWQKAIREAQAERDAAEAAKEAAAKAAAEAQRREDAANLTRLLEAFGVPVTEPPDGHIANAAGYTFILEYHYPESGGSKYRLNITHPELDDGYFMPDVRGLLVDGKPSSDAELVAFADALDMVDRFVAESREREKAREPEFKPNTTPLHETALATLAERVEDEYGADRISLRDYVMALAQLEIAHQLRVMNTVADAIYTNGVGVGY